MTMRKVLTRRLTDLAAVMLACGAAGAAYAAPCSTAFVMGDVFVSVGSSTVNVFTPTGTLVCTLTNTSGTTFTTGSGFDAAGNFYVTNFSAGTISRFSNSGTLLNSSFMSASNTPESIANQTTGFYAGLSLEGGPGAATINTFNTSSGVLVHSYAVTAGNGTGGTDWVDTYNPTTGRIIYDGEGTAIRSAILNSNGTVTQLADFSSAATEAALTDIFGLRTIPSGSFAGDVLVANTRDVVMLDSSGNIIRTYTFPGSIGQLFALNLDPNGTDFWTSDSVTGNVFEVNIASGAIDQEFPSGHPGFTFGLSVFGEIQSGGGGGGTVPEPATLALLGAGLAGLYMSRRRRGDA